MKKKGFSTLPLQHTLYEQWKKELGVKILGHHLHNIGHLKQLNKKTLDFQLSKLPVFVLNEFPLYMWQNIR